MKILHINTWDSGGAAGAALRICKVESELGLEVGFLALKPKKEKVPEVEYYSEFLGKIYGKLGFRLIDLLNRAYNQLPILFKRATFFNRPESLYRIQNHPLIKSADIIHLHAVPKFLDYPSFFENVKKPILWTMHDMHPFSGGKHYETGGGSNLNGLEKKYFERKLEILSQGRKLAFVSPSNWLKKEAEKSLIANRFSIYHIPNCINTSVFLPTEKKSLNKVKILFVAENVHDPRKGSKYLLEAVKMLREDVELLFLGKIGREELPQNESIKCLGFISETGKLAKIYADADLYVIASVEDNLPNTIIESQACGTPVVGFRTSGIEEMIDNDFNGILIDRIDGKSLADGIERAVKMVKSGKFNRQAISKKAQETYSEKVVAKQYEEIYKSLLSQA